MSNFSFLQSEWGVVHEAAHQAERAVYGDRICEYMLGLERQMTGIVPHKEWIEEYEHAMRS